MDPEEVINLFDSYWFHYEIFKKNQSFSFNYFSKISPSSSEPRFSSLRSILVRSKSDDMASFNYGSSSPNSVLFAPVLKSIASGKQEFTKQEQEEEEEEEEKQQHQEGKQETEETEQTQSRLGKKKKRRMTKSLSDLEFEELKGFMDLGFVFSEEDKDSSLVEIIPGLQRLGKEKEKTVEADDDEEEEDAGDDKETDSNYGSNSSSSTSARRPYLSEAWADFDKGKKRESRPPLMMNWRVPALGNEMDMKDNLKLWAQTVASVVR